MATAKDVLSKLKWGEEGELDEAEVWYLHRGAPGDERTIRGSEITELGKSFFSTAEGSIPYHRVLKIAEAGKTIFERKKRENRAHEK